MFAEQDWSQPVDFRARIAAVPADAQVRGMFMQVLLDALSPDVRNKLGPRRYVAFKNYPMREYVELLAFAAEQARGQKPAEHVRRLGRLIYPRYVKTVSGSAIFALAGRDYGCVIEAAPVAYRIALEPASIVIRHVEPGHARVELRHVYNLPELHHVGIWEGAMTVCGVTGAIIESPDTERGCRTKMTVKVDVDIANLWQNWSHGLHRVTCYGDITPDLQRFCRFKGIELVNEV